MALLLQFHGCYNCRCNFNHDTIIREICKLTQVVTNLEHDLEPSHEYPGRPSMLQRNASSHEGWGGGLHLDVVVELRRRIDVLHNHVHLPGGKVR